MRDDDITEILNQCFPQGARLLEHEHGGAILRIGARELLENAQLALSALGPITTRKLGRALVAQGQRRQVVGERMIALADEAAAAAKNENAGT